MWKLRRGGAAERAIVPALVAAAMTSATSVLLGRAPSIPVVTAALAGTFAIYIMDRALWIGPEDAGEQVRWRRSETAGVCIAAFAIGAVVPALRIQTVLVAGFVGLVGLLYSVPIGGSRLKALGTAKPMLVVAGWVLGSVLVPAAQSGSGSASELVTLGIYRFFYFLPAVLLADLADAARDRLAGIRTPSGQLPEAFVMRICTLALVAGVLVACVAFVAGLGPLVLLDATGLLVAWVTMRSIHNLEARSFYLDLVMVWPVVTTLSWIVLS